MQEKQEPLILSIETATRAGSVALSKGSRVISSQRGDADSSHSTDLLEHVRAALASAGHRLQDVYAFAVATGPGSFTGLRIGVATAKSLASTLERYAVGVPTLHAVAHSAGNSTHTLALLQAGRGEVFAQSFRVERSGEVVPLDQPQHVAPAALIERVKHLKYVRWAGEGAILHSEMIREGATREGHAFINGVDNREQGTSPEGWSIAQSAHGLAADVAALAFEMLKRGLSVRAEDLHAIYVRASDAELKERCRT